MPCNRLVHHFLSVYAQLQSEGIWSLQEPMVSMVSVSASNFSYVLLTYIVCGMHSVLYTYLVVCRP